MSGRKPQVSRASEGCPRWPTVTLLTAAVLLLSVAPASAQQPPPAEPTPAAGAPEVLAAPPPLTTPTPAPAPLPAVPDPAELPAAEVAYVNPLSRPVDAPARLLERPKPTEYESRATLFVAVHLSPQGAATDALPIEPPLKTVLQQLPQLWPKWKFSPAMKGGQPVATWATLGLELEIEISDPVFSSFLLTPVGKDDPMPAVTHDLSGEEWLKSYPKDPTPADGSVSVEDLDAPPGPQKTKWDFDKTRVRSRFTALVAVNSAGRVTRVVPLAGSEPFLAAWMRQMAVQWKLSPATANGQPVDSWMALDATAEYQVSSAKERGKRSVKKNLRGTPAG